MTRAIFIARLKDIGFRRYTTEMSVYAPSVEKLRRKGVRVSFKSKCSQGIIIATPQGEAERFEDWKAAWVYVQEVAA